VLWPARNTSLAKMRWSDTRKAKLANVMEKYNINSAIKDRAVGDIIEHISGKNAWKWDIDKISQIKDVKAFLDKFSPKVRQELIQAGMAYRRMYQNLLDNQNHARKLRKQREIPYRGFYRQHVMEANIWSRALGLRVKPKEIMEVPEMPDFIQPTKPFNPRELARRGLLEKYPKERRMAKLMSDYIESAAKDIFDTNIVHSNKIHSMVLKEKGLENAAEGINRWTSEVFAGVKPRGSRWAAEHLPIPLRKGMQFIARNLRRAVFPLNWTWNVFIQTSSAGITYARYGTKANLAGLEYLTNRAMNQAVKQNAYSQIIKSRWGGKAYYQDLQQSLLKHKHLDTGVIEKAEHYANYLTTTIESGLTGHAVTAAYYDGKTRLKLSGRELWEYASEGGAKTQSMYNLADLPGFLRTKEVGQVMPFQTFAFEVFNTVREMNLPVVRRIVPKTGIYETISANSIEGKALISKRLKMLARWTAAIVVINAVVDKAIGRKPWEVSSFIPFWGYIQGGYAGRAPMPHQYMTDVKKGLRDVIVHGDIKKLRKWLVRYHMLGGLQVNRILDGVEAVAKGKVTDVRGRRLYPVKGTAEQLRAISMGPGRTKAGIERWETLKDTQGIVGAIRMRLGKTYKSKKKYVPKKSAMGGL
jgi:hypothetical protein